jgi:hypothetical protein
LKVGNTKFNINMKTKIHSISTSGYNPKIQTSSGSYSIKFFQETTAVKNTIAEFTQNKVIPMNNIIQGK